MSRMYNDPAGGNPSSVGNQFNDFYYAKKALIEARKKQFFGQLANVTSMPKHFGKKIKKYHYLPLLDDGNVNSEGIDAAGVSLVANTWSAFDASGDPVTGGTGWTAPSGSVGGYYDTKANALTAAGAGGRAVRNGGNLYGSSKDIGTIVGKMPTLSETGGRVNRVGFKRKEIEGTIEKFGFFDEYTQESMDFDTDAELMMHINREMVNGAMEMTEDALQIDLINSAGVLKYSGGATQDSDMDETCKVTYGDLMRLAIDLVNNRTPKQTKMITGTRLIDTKVIPGAFVMYIGSEVIPVLEAMKDLHNERAFRPVEEYAAGGTVLLGEIGKIGHFRFVLVPEMVHWEGAGAPLGGDTSHYSDDVRFSIFPMLVVGEGSFSTIGFQTDGKTVKFKITHKKPGKETADRTDPYGETGFMSIKWYYGFFLERPERLALQKTTALL